MAIHLMKNEKIVWKSYPGKNYRTFIFIRDLLLATVSSIVLYIGLVELMNIEKKVIVFSISGIVFGLWFLLAVVNQVSMLFTQYVVTTDRIIIKKGWLNKHLTSIKNENIIDTKVTQSLKERIINTGTIYIFTANDSQNSENDTFNKVPKLENIDSPFLLHTTISEVIDNEYDEDYR